MDHLETNGWSQSGDYECGKNCRLQEPVNLGLSICEETTQ